MNIFAVFYFVVLWMRISEAFSHDSKEGFNSLDFSAEKKSLYDLEQEVLINATIKPPLYKFLPKNISKDPVLDSLIIFLEKDFQDSMYSGKKTKKSFQCVYKQLLRDSYIREQVELYKQKNDCKNLSFQDVLANYLLSRGYIIPFYFFSGSSKSSESSVFLRKMEISDLYTIPSDGYYAEFFPSYSGTTIPVYVISEPNVRSMALCFQGLSIINDAHISTNIQKNACFHNETWHKLSQSKWKKLSSHEGRHSTCEEYERARYGFSPTFHQVDELGSTLFELLHEPEEGTKFLCRWMINSYVDDISGSLMQEYHSGYKLLSQFAYQELTALMGQYDCLDVFLLLEENFEEYRNKGIMPPDEIVRQAAHEIFPVVSKKTGLVDDLKNRAHAELQFIAGVFDKVGS